MVNTQKPSKIKFYLIHVGIIGMIIFPMILLLLPPDYFDNGQEICLSKVVFDLECLGCGMTRAAMHLIHFQFHEAYHFNKLIFLVFPLLCYLYIIEFRSLLGQSVFGRYIGAFQQKTQDNDASF